MSKDSWDSPASRSLPSRKRELAFSARDDSPKSRRTSPAPAGTSRSLVSSQDVEIVDLTGYVKLTRPSSAVRLMTT